MILQHSKIIPARGDQRGVGNVMKKRQGFGGVDSPVEAAGTNPAANCELLGRSSVGKNPLHGGTELVNGIEFIKTPALPTISGRQLLSESMTAVPSAIACATGNSNLS
jgi:hypothetical protein